MYSSVLTGLGLLSCILASSVFYLGCPNQQWREQRPLQFYPALIAALVLLVVSWALFRQSFSIMSTSFTLLCLLMLALGLLPFSGVLDKPGKVLGKKKKRIQKGLEGYKPQWWLKGLCAVFLGLPIAVASAGLVAWWGPGGVVVDDRTQFVMWVITPIWLTFVSLIYLFTSVRRMLSFYVGLNLLLFTLLWTARFGG
ncbi:hypothetical protein MO867_18700 [Microbulbifer sp. OS29]|uniref:Uncharacterized protein n=1 Tax=Microbulbifer okhotskensis TaxID=2926617 RepID=A0A9X2EUY6_9GAMM|nr:hypothetical protein [Microbulbifer okhotskensis]MCO1336366.1 hypothetical protein [Microbulbifer okhotskensis]